MSTPRRPLPALSRPAVGALLALALTGCGASLDAQTYQERNQADAANTAVGTLALRGIAVEPGGADRLHEVGDDADVTLVISNNDDEPDTLLEVTSPDAESVEIVADGAEDTLEVPALGAVGAGEDATLRLVALTEELREGEYTTLTFRFERNGSVEVPVPVRSPGRTDRPVYTGGEGEEGEPALQAPAGGHHGEEAGGDHGEEAGGDEGGAGGEGEEGIVGESEGGQAEDEGETAPRDEESTTNESSEEVPGESPPPAG